MFQFILKSADGREFKVGSDCILKTDSSKALRVAVETEMQKRQREQREARAAIKRQKDAERIAAAVARLPEVADRLRSEPHPQAQSFGFLRDKTMLDWAEWMLVNAGISGRLSVAKAIEALL